MVGFRLSRHLRKSPVSAPETAHVERLRKLQENEETEMLVPSTAELQLKWN